MDVFFRLVVITIIRAADVYQKILLVYRKYETAFFTTDMVPFFFQVTIWGDYSRMEGKKVFMGVAQIMLDDLDLSNIVIGWYKLFGTSSLVSVPPNGQQKKPPSTQGGPGSVHSLDGSYS